MAVSNGLKKTDVSWALKHLQAEGDTDLFPRPFEIDVLHQKPEVIQKRLLSMDLPQHKWSEPRRALVPKSELAFRRALQLDPFDALVFAAIIRRNARKLEVRRGDPGVQRIFSYRVDVNPNGALYGPDRYRDFWRASLGHSRRHTIVLVTDITDFYNQIYHHTIERELEQAAIPGPHAKAIKNLLRTTSVTTSRGVPVGPHATHLLAEISLRPIDEVLSHTGVKYHRFVDDIHIFCDDRREAHVILHRLAEALDLPKLSLNASKTKMLAADKFAEMAQRVLAEEPINETERIIVQGVQAAAPGAYAHIRPADLTDELRGQLVEENIEDVIEAYLNAENPDFVRLRWFIRRLIQTRSAAGLPAIIANFDRLAPAIEEVCRYLRASIENYDGDPVGLGEKLLQLLEAPIVSASSYLTTMILSLFGELAQLNHLESLLRRYDQAGEAERREIVLAATRAGAEGWLQSQKALGQHDSWVRRALMLGSLTWSHDERKAWAKTQKGRFGELEDLLLDVLTSKQRSKTLKRAVFG